MVALAASIMTVALVHHYGATRPTVMEPKEGRTHAVKIHSRVVYITGGEYAFAVGAHAVALVAIGAFLGVLLLSRRPGAASSGLAKSS
jgi:hypothetical protein